MDDENWTLQAASKGSRCWDARSNRRSPVSVNHGNSGNIETFVGASEFSDFSFFLNLCLVSLF